MRMHEMTTLLSPPPVIAALRLLADRAAVAVAPAERLCGPETWIGPAADAGVDRVAFATRQAAEAAVRLRLVAARIEQEWLAAVAAGSGVAPTDRP